MNSKINIEIHILNTDKKTLFDRDFQINAELKIVDMLEILFNQYDLDAEKLRHLYIFLPINEDPISLSSDDCAKSLTDYNAGNGTIIRIIYEGDTING